VSLAILDELEQLTGKRIFELFDLIAGVSTGSIVASFLGLRQSSVASCRSKYLSFAKTVFAIGKQRDLTTADLVADDAAVPETPDAAPDVSAAPASGGSVESALGLGLDDAGGGDATPGAPGSAWRCACSRRREQCVWLGQDLQSGAHFEERAASTRASASVRSLHITCRRILSSTRQRWRSAKCPQW
jgi:hypothetical protein